MFDALWRYIDVTDSEWKPNQICEPHITLLKYCLVLGICRTVLTFQLIHCDRRVSNPCSQGHISVIIIRMVFSREKALFDAKIPSSTLISISPIVHIDRAYSAWENIKRWVWVKYVIFFFLWALEYKWRNTRNAQIDTPSRGDRGTNPSGSRGGIIHWKTLPLPWFSAITRNKCRIWPREACICFLGWRFS